VSEPAEPSAATTDWLARLVAFDTTSRNSNLALIEDLRGYLEGRGIPCTLTHDDSGTKANLDATIGPTDVPGVALSGHTDVVPVDGQDWSSDPFAMAARDGKLFGRGTCDMKGFIAACLAQVPAWQAADLKTPVHLFFSHDEEVGCVGVHKLLADLERRPVKPRAVIVGEPTSMRVVNGHKGNLSLRATVTGQSCHSALAPTGVNALEYAARLVTFLSDMHRRKQQDGPFDPDFDVPHTTIHCGTLRSGTAQNIVPSEAHFTFEFRSLPQEDPHALLAEVVRHAREVLEPRMQAVAAETGFAFETRSEFPGLDTDPETALVTLAKALAEQNDTTKVSFGTEAGLFAQHGMPAIICGPGDIAQAHKPDEYVSRAQLARCERMLGRLTEHLCGHGPPGTALP
jgi:acetylornithine deacetylase